MIVALEVVIVARGEGYSHIWATWVCAAQQGMLFASLTLEQGIKITLCLLEEGIFYFRFDSGTGSIFPRILINHGKI